MKELLKSDRNSKSSSPVGKIKSGFSLSISSRSSDLQSGYLLTTTGLSTHCSPGAFSSQSTPIVYNFS